MLYLVGTVIFWYHEGKWKRMRDKTLILGAAGFIGTNLTARLLKEQKKLVLFDKIGRAHV